MLRPSILGPSIRGPSRGCWTLLCAPFVARAPRTMWEKFLRAGARGPGAWRGEGAFSTARQFSLFKILKPQTGHKYNYQFRTRIYIQNRFWSKSENLKGIWHYQFHTRKTTQNNLNDISGSFRKTWNHQYCTRISTQICFRIFRNYEANSGIINSTQGKLLKKTWTTFQVRSAKPEIINIV